MKFVVLSVLFSIAFAQDFESFDFDLTKFKNIWESPKLQPALKNFIPKVRVGANRGSRIINGFLASPGQFPYYVVLIIDMEYLCGGSIIKPDWILTVQTELK